MWQKSTSETRVYCQAMHTITWTSKKPKEVIESCDGNEPTDINAGEQPTDYE